MPASSHVLDPIRVTFDDDNAVVDAGLLLTGTLVGRLGLERTIDEKVTRGYRPGRMLLSLVSTLLAGGDCIDDVNLLRVGDEFEHRGARHGGGVHGRDVAAYLRADRPALPTDRQRIHSPGFRCHLNLFRHFVGGSLAFVFSTLI